MKRDLDLVRRILLRCEENEAGMCLDPKHFDLDISSAELSEHVHIMIEAGLITGDILPTNDEDDFDDFCIRKITWHGHDFLATARDSTIWRKFLSMAKEKPMPMTLSFALAWLKKEAEERFGFPVP